MSGPLLSPDKAEQLRRAARQYIAGMDDSDGEEWTVADNALVKRAEEPEITGEYGHYVRAECWFYVCAGVEGSPLRAPQETK